MLPSLRNRKPDTLERKDPSFLTPAVQLLPSHKPMLAQKTILVADDDPNDIFLLKRAFIKAGIDLQVDCVRDGSQAIRYLKDRIDLFPHGKDPVPQLLL